MKKTEFKPNTQFTKAMEFLGEEVEPLTNIPTMIAEPIPVASMSKSLAHTLAKINKRCK